MKKNLLILTCGVLLTAALMSFSQNQEDGTTLCTVRAFGPLYVKHLKGIFIYKGSQPAKKIELNENNSISFHKQVHQELNKLYEDGWRLVTSTSLDAYNYEYNLEK